MLDAIEKRLPNLVYIVEVVPSPTMPKGTGCEDYALAWICPMEIVRNVAVMMLDEQNNDPVDMELPKDVDSFSFGSVAGHDIVIAGFQQIGSHMAAAEVVSCMRSTFPNLQCGLLIRVGGGVPTKTDSGIIRFGDIVVSKAMDGRPGVLRYGPAGAEQDGLFECVGAAIAPPPARILEAAQDLATQRARSPQVPVRVSMKRADTNVEEFRRYRYPGAHLDNLYEAHYFHCQYGVSWEQAGCDPDYLLPLNLEDDSNNADPPVIIHRGTVASGESTIEDGTLRDELADEYDLLYFETETAGASADSPCLVVQGISNYCDTHKDDRWQVYAATRASSYARELCRHLPDRGSER